MRDFINIVENTQESSLMRLVYQVRDSVAPNFRGKCEGAAGDLAELLQKHGIAAEFIEGRFDSPWDFGDGAGHPWSPHCWVETSELILDPTAEQFGDRPLIVTKGSTNAQPYDHTPLNEQIVSRERRMGGYDIAINPTKAEWDTFRRGAAGVFLKDGNIVIGDGSALDHLSLMSMASIDSKLELYRLQLFRDKAVIELWDDLDDIEHEPDAEEIERLTQYPKAARAHAAETLRPTITRFMGDVPVIVELKTGMGDDWLSEVY